MVEMTDLLSLTFYEFVIIYKMQKISVKWYALRLDWARRWPQTVPVVTFFTLCAYVPLSLCAYLSSYPL